jgi:hypothetical protein
VSDSQTEELRVVKFSHEQLSDLTEHEQVLLALLSYAVSETNALWRIFECVKHKDVDAGVAIGAVAAQRHVVLRTWSAKLFELHAALKALLNEAALEQDLRAFVEAIRSEIAGTPDGEVSDVVKRFRHNSTNHTSVNSVKANLKRMNPASDINFYFSNLEANSFFPIGEEAFFAGEYNSIVQSLEEKTLDKFSDWLDWVLQTTKRLIHHLDEFLTRFVFSDGRAVEWEALSFHGSSSLFGFVENRQVPIFLKQENP